MQDGTPVTLTREELRRLVTDAADEGAQRALTRIGLGGPDAGEKVVRLMDLLKSWETVRTTVVTTATRTITTIVLSALALGAWALMKRLDPPG